jgi:hypothetical protein
VWLYYRFGLSYRDVEELLSAREIIVTYEAIRQWCRKFGQPYVNQLRRRPPQPGTNATRVIITPRGRMRYSPPTSLPANGISAKKLTTPNEAVLWGTFADFFDNR